MSQHRRRVVVTGLGCVSPVGNDVSQSWASLLAGQSGITAITRFDTSAFACRIAGEVKGLDVSAVVSTKEAKTMDTFIKYGLVAAAEAVADAGLPTGEALDEAQAERIACVIGSGIGGLPMIEETCADYAQRGPRRISPFFVPASIVNLLAGHVSIKFGFKGPNLTLATACSTGLHCIGQGARLIQYGDADVVVAGGAESTVSPLGVGGFAAMRALSTRNDDPAAASRPWDKERDGFVLGFGMSGDASHITAPNVDGPRRAMQAALRDAGLNADELDYINAHGTSTPLGDINETNAIKAAFGEQARKLVISSTKSMTGHLLGGAGGIESIFTVLALHHQKVPPTINLHTPDPECDLDYCANTARDVRLQAALKNNFGFGGTNGSLVFTRV